MLSRNKTPEVWEQAILAITFAKSITKSGTKAEGKQPSVMAGDRPFACIRKPLARASPGWRNPHHTPQFPKIKAQWLKKRKRVRRLAAVLL
jgi:hypothetical protein